MLPLVTILISCFFLTELRAQSRTVISYEETVKMDVEDLKPDPEEIDTDSSLLQYNLKKMLLQQIMDTIIAERGNDTMKAWIDESFVVTTSVKEKGVRKLYETNSQKLLIINNYHFRNLGKIDTTSLLLNCDTGGCTVKYKIQEKRGKKTILGYQCINFEIEEELKSVVEGHHNRMISVWVTDKIKPSIPTFALLKCYKKILARYTPLEIKEQLEKNGRSYQLLRGISISKE